jgi:hypothetical protein
LIYLLAGALIWPLFTLEHMDNWASIESTFIADARMLKANLPHPGWQPYWYCGVRWDYIYPPALRYGTALLSAAFGLTPARAYHLYIALMYCLGIAGVYLLARLGSGSRGAAWLAASAVALVSPCYLFVREVRLDAAAGAYMPQRLNALVRYGEGPHASALAWMGVALALAWVALRARRPAALAAAALAAALVVSNNFYGATALAMIFPVMVWAVYVTHQDRAVGARAAGLAILAWALTAWWLTPSYLHITLGNLRLVAQPGKTWCYALLAAAIAVFAAVSWKFLRGKRASAYALFVASAATFIGLYTLGFYGFGFRVWGEPGRLLPELDLVIILAGAEVVRRIWAGAGNLRGARRWAARGAVAAGVIAALSPARTYLRHAWEQYPEDRAPQRRVEYRLTEWMRKNLPEARALVTGSIRFWYNAWFDGAQVDGGSEQGRQNHNLIGASWEVPAGDQPEFAVLWLQAVGADAVIVVDPTSSEVYHDFVFPRKFEGLRVLLDTGQGEKIYAVPRRFPGLARVVDRARAAALRPPSHNQDVENLRAYVGWVEGGPDARPEWRREGLAAMRVKARLAAGQSLLVMETFDPYWRAYAEGRRLRIRPDAMGFMLIDAPPGEQDIRLVFETPLENAIGRAVTMAALGAVLWLLARSRKPPATVLPSQFAC